MNQNEQKNKKNSEDSSDSRLTNASYAALAGVVLGFLARISNISGAEGLFLWAFWYGGWGLWAFHLRNGFDQTKGFFLFLETQLLLVTGLVWIFGKNTPIELTLMLLGIVARITSLALLSEELERAWDSVTHGSIKSQNSFRGRLLQRYKDAKKSGDLALQEEVKRQIQLEISENGKIVQRSSGESLSMAVKDSIKWSKLLRDVWDIDSRKEGIPTFALLEALECGNLGSIKHEAKYLHVDLLYQTFLNSQSACSNIDEAKALAKKKGLSRKATKVAGTTLLPSDYERFIEVWQKNQNKYQSVREFIVGLIGKNSKSKALEVPSETPNTNNANASDQTRVSKKSIVFNSSTFDQNNEQQPEDLNKNKKVS
jgi:hypothetical protein